MVSLSRMTRILCLVRFVCVILTLTYSSYAQQEQIKTGFTVHFDFINNLNEAKKIVEMAASTGAKVLNVVPPAHIWEDSLSQQMLDMIFAEASKRRLDIIITRVDASYPNPTVEKRWNYLYTRILTEPGRTPLGRPTSKFFLATVGKKNYEQWLKEETQFYARHYANQNNLIAFSLGLFNETFVSERGGLLEYEQEEESYEIAQYTDYTESLWHEWLIQEFHDVETLNIEYSSSFSSIEEVPMPINEHDDQFGKACKAYYDFVQCINDWIVQQYEECRSLWHREAKQRDIPFLWQFNGFEPEKIMKGRSAFAALDICDWISRADAIGLSLYTNSGYKDLGHGSLSALIHLVSIARDLQKPVFVLESGTEVPQVIVDDFELNFFSLISLPLKPVTFIYEFFKTKYEEEYQIHWGKIIDEHWTIHQEALLPIQHQFQFLQLISLQPGKPCFYILDVPAYARNDSTVMRFYPLMYNVMVEWPVSFVRLRDLKRIPDSVSILLPPKSIRALTPKEEKHFLRLVKEKYFSIVTTDSADLLDEAYKTSFLPELSSKRQFNTLEEQAKTLKGILLNYFLHSCVSKKIWFSFPAHFYLIPYQNGVFIFNDNPNLEVSSFDLSLSEWSIAPTDTFELNFIGKYHHVLRSLIAEFPSGWKQARTDQSPLFIEFNERKSHAKLFFDKGEVKIRYLSE